MAELKCVLCEANPQNDEPALFIMNGQSLCEIHRAKAFSENWVFSDFDELMTCCDKSQGN